MHMCVLLQGLAKHYCFVSCFYSAHVLIISTIFTMKKSMDVISSSMRLNDRRLHVPYSEFIIVMQELVMILK